MRERRNFGERTSVLKSDKVKGKYFLVFEGKETEEIYFTMIHNRRVEAGINPEIELIPVIRSFSEEGWSNPKKLVDRVIENLEEQKTQCYSYETLCNWIMEYLVDESIITDKWARKAGLWKFMVSICEQKLGYFMDYDVNDLESDCAVILHCLEEEYKFENLVDNIKTIIKYNELSYSEDVDKICVIVDRDRESFFEKEEKKQYSYVVSKCKENRIGLYVTNPCFEFWLLLHFDEVFQLDREMLLKNPKVISDKTFTEYELNKLLPGYKKSNYDVDKLVHNIDKAIENETKFSEQIHELENNIGSNIGLFIKEIKV